MIDWKRVALQARDDLLAIERDVLKGKFAVWTSPANTIRWIERLETEDAGSAPGEDHGEVPPNRTPRKPEVSSRAGPSNMVIAEPPAPGEK